MGKHKPECEFIEAFGDEWGSPCTCGASQPAPAPLPGEVAEALARIDDCMESGEFSMAHFEDIDTITASYRLLHAQYAALTRRLAEAEACNANMAQLVREHATASAAATRRAEAAEARVREMEAWARTWGCYSCKHAGKCPVSDREAQDVLNGGVCESWEIKHMPAAMDATEASA